MPTKTSLDGSFLIWWALHQLNDKLEVNYNFSVDQNYNDLNYINFVQR